MELSADQLMVQETKSKSAKQESKLSRYVKFREGEYVSNYGKFVRIDEYTESLTIKLALCGKIVSVNEFLVEPVTFEEYSNHIKKYDRKNTCIDTYQKGEFESSDAESSDESSNINKNKRNKKSRNRGYRPSNNDSSSLNRGSRQIRDSLNSNEED